jgi:heme/copper-type cytochrome/quinol oxidase subunit 3
VYLLVRRYYRCFYCGDAARAASTPGVNQLYAVGWVVLIVSETALFGGLGGPSLKIVITIIAQAGYGSQLERLILDVGRAIGGSIGASLSLASVASGLLFMSGLVGLVVLSDQARAAPTASESASTALVVLGSAFVTLQSAEYQTLGQVLLGGILASSFYQVSGLHGAHVLVGVVLLGSYIVSSGSSIIYCLTDLVTLQGYVGLSSYWHFVDTIWIVVLTVSYIVGGCLPLRQVPYSYGRDSGAVQLPEIVQGLYAPQSDITLWLPMSLNGGGRLWITNLLGNAQAYGSAPTWLWLVVFWLCPSTSFCCSYSNRL